MKPSTSSTTALNRFVALKQCLTLALVALLTSCANIYKAKDYPIERYQAKDSYRFSEISKRKPLGENVVILAFSGGGTRAAALSYGVLQELRDTQFVGADGKRRRLLEDVDLITSVSGGSFTSAYYAAFGDRIFSDYEQVFLRQSVEGALLSRLLSPRHWFRSMWSGFDRTEMAIEYYDSQVFKGTRFKDLGWEGMPTVLINATDISKGARFVFDQDHFDWICGDLGEVSLARAVTASSAVPIAFPSVVFKNNGGKCDMSQSRDRKKLLQLRPHTIKQRSYIDAIKSYQKSDARPYIHLVDGGISDNLGLRAVSDRLEVFGGDKNSRHREDAKRVIVILVNSKVSPGRTVDVSPDAPSFSETIDMVTSSLMDHYDQETRAYFFDKASEFKLRLSEDDDGTEFYMAEVSFKDFSESRTRSLFNNLPTSLELSDAQIDAVIAAGRKLLRDQPSFRRLKRDLAAQLEHTPESSNFNLERKIRALPDDSQP